MLTSNFSVSKHINLHMVLYSTTTI